MLQQCSGPWGGRRIPSGNDLGGTLFPLLLFLIMNIIFSKWIFRKKSRDCSVGNGFHRRKAVCTVQSFMMGILKVPID